MKHTGSTLLILLFIGLCYFILPHSLQLLPKKASANALPTVTPTHLTPTLTPTQQPNTQ